VIKNRQEWVTVEGVVFQNNRDRVCKLHLAVNNEVVQGCVEAFIAPGYHCITAKLDWDNNK
jgi:hypothetical protein